MEHEGSLASGDLVVNGDTAEVALTDLEVAAGPARRCTITTSRNAWAELNLRVKTKMEDL